jgi:hypothetical protein
VSGPAFLIRVELEAAPQVMVDCLSEGEEKRLDDWLASHPDFLQLVWSAIVLRDKAAAA